MSPHFMFNDAFLNRPKPQYSLMFSSHLITEFLTMLKDTHDIRDILANSRYPFNVVEMLKDLKSQNLVRVESDGWHLTPQGFDRVERG